MANAPIEYASAGGQGGALTKRGDLRLYRQAVEGGYNIPPEIRQEIVETAHQILNAGPSFDKEGNRNYRDVLSAAKVLLACDKMDLEVEKMASAGPGTVNNTQINNLVGVDLSKLTTEQLRALAHDDNPNP